MTDAVGARDKSDKAAGGPPPSARWEYAAFLSYSHSDEAIASWLHRELERYRIPKALRAKLGASPRKPAFIGRVFRDRADLAASHDLAGEIRQALEQSEALIVLCSPRSAASRYVNEEIRIFKSLGRKQKIFPIIVEGEPNSSRLAGRDAKQECFPDALVFQLDMQGAVSDQLEPEEPIAADLREGKDGRQNVLLKVIAGLLGIDLDELVQREKAAQRQRQRRAYAIASAMGVLAAGAIGAAIYAVSLAETAERRRVELVSSQARDLILDGDRISAKALVDSQGLGRRLALSGIGRWVETQFDLADWTKVAAGSRALIDCQGRDVAFQNEDNSTELYWSAGGITRLKTRDLITACQARDDGAALIDALGNAYLLRTGASEYAFIPADVLLPYAVTQRENGDLLLDSQIDGLAELPLGATEYNRLGSSGDDWLRRYKIVGGPDPDLFFSIRHNGMGHYFSPRLTKTEEEIFSRDAKIETHGFADCEPGLDGRIIACVLQDGSAALLDWDANLTPIFVEDGGRLRSITRLDLSSERFAAVNHRGEIILLDPLTQRATAHIRLEAGEMPLTIRDFGTDRWITVTDAGRICILAIDQPSCIFEEQGNFASPIAAVAVDSARRQIWIRTANGSVSRADLGKFRLTPESLLKKDTGAPGRISAPAAELEAVLPEFEDVPGQSSNDEAISLKGFAFNAPPSILYVSDDLRWRIERTPSGTLRILHENNTYLPELEGEFIDARQSLTGFWILSTLGVTFIALPTGEDGVVNAARFDLGDVVSMRASSLTDNLLVDTGRNMIAVRPDIAHILPARLDIAASDYLADFDFERGLLLTAHTDCSLSLYDASYASALFTIDAPCTDINPPEIGTHSVSLVSEETRFHLPLPMLWTSP